MHGAGYAKGKQTCGLKKEMVDMGIDLDDKLISVAVPLLTYLSVPIVIVSQQRKH